MPPRALLGVVMLHRVRWLLLGFLLVSLLLVPGPQVSYAQDINGCYTVGSNQYPGQNFWVADWPTVPGFHWQAEAGLPNVYLIPDSGYDWLGVSFTWLSGFLFQAKLQGNIQASPDSAAPGPYTISSAHTGEFASFDNFLLNGSTGAFTFELCFPHLATTPTPTATNFPTAAATAVPYPAGCNLYTTYTNQRGEQNSFINLPAGVYDILLYWNANDLDPSVNNPIGGAWDIQIGLSVYAVTYADFYQQVAGFSLTTVARSGEFYIDSGGLLRNGSPMSLVICPRGGFGTSTPTPTLGTPTPTAPIFGTPTNTRTPTRTPTNTRTPTSTRTPTATYTPRPTPTISFTCLTPVNEDAAECIIIDLQNTQIAIQETIAAALNPTIESFTPQPAPTVVASIDAAISLICDRDPCYTVALAKDVLFWTVDYVSKQDTAPGCEGLMILPPPDAETHFQLPSDLSVGFCGFLYVTRNFRSLFRLVSVFFFIIGFLFFLKNLMNEMSGHQAP